MESECRIFIKNFNFIKENSMLNFNEKIKLWKGILIVNFYELLQPRFSQQCSKSVVYHINFDLYQICVWVSKIIFFLNLLLTITARWSFFVPSFTEFNSKFVSIDYITIIIKNDATKSFVCKKWTDKFVELVDGGLV